MSNSNRTAIVTASSLSELLTRNMEDTEPRDTIANYWIRNHGKTWTARREPELAALIEKARPDLLGTVRFYKSMGDHLTVEWGGWTRTNCREGAYLYIAHWSWSTQTLDRTMDVATLAEWNVSRFKGADERNAARRAALADGDLIRKADMLLRDHKMLRSQLADVEKEIAILLQHGEPLGADSYYIRRDLMGEVRKSDAPGNAARHHRQGGRPPRGGVRGSVADRCSNEDR